jgi:DNA-binding transcriptional LysR family regulator
MLLTHAHTGETCRLALSPRLSTDSLYAMRSAAEAGLGVCVGSAWMMAAALQAGRLVHLAPQWHASALPLYLVYPYARFYPQRLRRFIAAMREAMPAAMVGAVAPAG